MSDAIPDLTAAFTAQHNMQITSYGKDPSTLRGEELMEFIRWNILACEDELHEAMGETGWKPWATSNHMNVDAFHGELVDAFHFFMNLCIASGLTADGLLAGYERKRFKNIARQAAGYDGVAGKCPKCHRALDDPHTECVYSVSSGRGVCQTVGAFVT